MSDFILDSRRIVRLCERMLRLYDSRLVDHGERVAYIACLVAELLPNGAVDKKRLMLLSIFHDIGAYKTDEIDRMMQFETDDVQAHSIYGYLFLKHFTPLKDLAEAILYHHSDVREMENVSPEIKKYAQIIHIADRVDIMACSGGSLNELKEKLDAFKFDEDIYAALMRVLDDTTVFEALKGERASRAIEERIADMTFSSEEAVRYLEMLVCSIDFKSEYTVVHSVNTTAVSLFLGSCFELSPEEMEKLFLRR